MQNAGRADNLGHYLSLHLPSQLSTLVPREGRQAANFAFAHKTTH